MATRKASKAAAKRAGSKSAPASMPKAGKDPQGGLTAKGREFFNQRDGSHLRPGVKGAADTPEKMMRKGSFLRRHFTHPRGPMVDEQGRPTRLALSAQAWGEPLPKSMADTRALAAKGHALLEQYHATQEKTTAKKTPGKKVAAKTSAPTKAVATKAVAKKTAGVKAATKRARGASDRSVSAS